MNTNEVIFQTIHTENIGMIGAVFTPLKVWEKTQHIALLRKYSEFTEILNELNLVEIAPSVFEHHGSLNISELEIILIEKGFIKNNNFSLHVDIEFSYTGLSDDEILRILKINK